jgi:orotate phosphoribosyltransferase
MISREIASILLKIKAVFLRPDELFVWASGIESPIYCDNRLILSYPEERKKIELELAKLIINNISDYKIIAGTSTAGIPHAAYISEILNLPMIYVRGSEKDHGRKNNIEGRVSPGDNIIVIEDLISTGNSAIKVANILRDSGANVLGIVSIFNYNIKFGFENFKKNNLKILSLTNFDILLEVAIEKKIINIPDVKKLEKFKFDLNSFQENIIK